MAQFEVLWSIVIFVSRFLTLEPIVPRHSSVTYFHRWRKKLWLFVPLSACLIYTMGQRSKMRAIPMIFVTHVISALQWREQSPASVLGLYSLSGKTSYRQISWSLEAARLSVIVIVSHWNLTGISAALLPRCLSNFRAEIWLASRQRCCRGACQISEQLKKSKPESRDFETSRDLAVRRLTA